MVPHSQILLLFSTSAQTHIFAEVRIDAVRLIDLLLDVIPEEVVAGCFSGTDAKAGHGRKVLDGYMSLLNASARLGTTDTGTLGSTSTAIMLSAKVRIYSYLILVQKMTSHSHTVENHRVEIFVEIPRPCYKKDYKYI